MMRISPEAINIYLEGWQNDMDQNLKDILKENNMGWMERFKSPCGKYILMTTNFADICNPENGIGWNLHINNSSSNQIGSVNVEFIEQVKQLMEIYKDY